MSVPATELPSAPVAAPVSQTGVGVGTTPGVAAVVDPAGSSVPGAVTQPVAPVEAPPPIDVNSIDPAIRAYLESHFRSGYIPETNLQSLQSTLDRQIAEKANEAELLRTQVQASQAQVRTAQEKFKAYLAEVAAGTRTPHPNDVAQFTLELQQAGQQVQLSKSQAALQHRGWEQNHTTGFDMRVAEIAAATPDGLPGISADVIKHDPEVQRLNRDLIETAKLDARDLYRNPAHSQRALAIQQQLEQRLLHVAQLERMKAVAAPAVQELQQVNAALQRQDARGVQTIPLAGMGGASLTGGSTDPDAAWAIARSQVAAQLGIDPAKADADHYEAVYDVWNGIYRP